MRSTPDRRMWRQIAHVFGTRQPGGRSKPAPLRGEIQRLRRKSTEPVPPLAWVLKWVLGWVRVRGKSGGDGKTTATEI